MVRKENLTETDTFEHDENPEVALTWYPTVDQMHEMTQSAINSHQLLRLDAIVDLQE